MKTGTQGIARAVRFALGGSLGLATIFATPVVFAQSQSDDRSLETVVVTGSRIARTSDFENPSPVVTFDQDALEKAGFTNLQQLMEKMPPTAMARSPRAATTRTRPPTAPPPSVCAASAPTRLSCW